MIAIIIKSECYKLKLYKKNDIHNVYLNKANLIISKASIV